MLSPPFQFIHTSYANIVYPLSSHATKPFGTKPYDLADDA